MTEDSGIAACDTPCSSVIPNTDESNAHRTELAASPNPSASEAMKSLGIEARDLRRVNRQRRRRDFLRLVIGGLAPVLGFIIGYDLAPGPPDAVASAYPYAGAMLATSTSLSRNTVAQEADRGIVKRRLTATGIAMAVLVSGVVGYLVGLVAGHDAYGMGVRYGVYSIERPKP